MTKMNIHDPDVQYIATFDFTQTLLTDQEMPSDILNLLYDHYDMMLEPGMSSDAYEEQPSARPNGQGMNQRGPRSGPSHPMERDFKRDYNGRKQELNGLRDRVNLKAMLRKTPSREVPWQLVAMAMQRSTDGKRRVVLTDDEGLMELLQYHGIQTMESDPFKRKLEKDQVLGGDALEQSQRPFDQGRHDSSILLAQRIEENKRNHALQLSAPDMTPADSGPDSSARDNGKNDKNLRDMDSFSN